MRWISHLRMASVHPRRPYSPRPRGHDETLGLTRSYWPGGLENPVESQLKLRWLKTLEGMGQLEEMRSKLYRHLASGRTFIPELSKRVR